MKYSPRNHTIQWEHPKLDILVQFYIEDGYIEVEHVYGYTYGKDCIARLFNQDRLIDDYQNSAAYDDDMERRRA